MSNKQSAAELAEVERAAIRAELAARNIPAEVKEPKFVPTARAARAGKARRQIGPVELSAEDATPAAKRLGWHTKNRHYTRIELADMAAEAKRIDREIARAGRAEAKRVTELARLAKTVRAELPEAAAEAAARAGVSEQLDYAAQLAEAAAALGVTEAEAAEVVAAAVAYQDVPRAARPAAGNVGYGSNRTPAELAAVREWTTAMLATPAAVAGRAALAAMGPRAAGLVLTNRTAQSVTIARSIRVPSAGVATRRAEESAAELAEAEAKMMAAEAAVSAARASKAKRPIDDAEAEANRIAAGVAKLAKRAALAAKLADVAEVLAGLNLAELDAYIAEPAAVFPLAEAAEAGTVTLRTRSDLMPIQYRHNGPSVSAARLVSGRGHMSMAASGISDPTGTSAAALADGYRAELARAEALAAKLAEAHNREAIRAAAEAEIEERRVAYKARRAEAARVRRAEESAARKMASHSKARNSKRAAR